MTIPPERETTIEQVAAVLASAPRTLGIADTCTVRSVLVQSGGRWRNHCTVLRAGIGDAAPLDGLEDITAGGIRLIGAEFSADAFRDATFLSGALTTWSVALPADLLALLKGGQFGAGVVSRPWDFQETVNVNHHQSRGLWGAQPCWVFEVYDRVQENHNLNTPRGPFKNFEQDFYAEDLAGAVEQWVADPMVRDTTTLQDAYRVVIPDLRGSIVDLMPEGEYLHVIVDGSKAQSLKCAVTARDGHGVQSRTSSPVRNKHATLQLPRQVTDIDLYVFDDTDAWCDSYHEDADRKPWGRAIVVPTRHDSMEVVDDSAAAQVPFPFEDILLEPEHVDLLQRVVEAWRSTPRTQRQKFVVAEAMGGAHLLHPGLPEQRSDVYVGDVEALAQAGLLNLSYGSSGTPQFDITPLGFRYYEYLRAASGKPTGRVEEAIRSYLDSQSFSGRYPEAHRKWAEAEQLLWSSDSAAQLTTVGHLCREALQLFVTTLVARHGRDEVDNNPAHTVARLRTVLASLEGNRSDAVVAMLGALLSYWGTIVDLVQRQEHGAQKEGQELVWSDARRVVLHSALVMYEVDQALSSKGS